MRFTETAQRHVRRERTWWLENRDYPEIFAGDLEAALRLVALLPGAGSRYEAPGVADLRRWYVPKVACHPYYTFDDDQVLVRAFWPARRDRGPTITP